MDHNNVNSEKSSYDQTDVACRFHGVITSVTAPWDHLVNFDYIWNQWGRAAKKLIILNGNTRSYFTNLVVEANVQILDYLTRLLFAHRIYFDEEHFCQLSSSIIKGYILIYKSAENSRSLIAEYQRIFRDIQDRIGKGGR